MTCLRCGGVMNSEEFSNGTDESVPWWYKGWRCIHCGDVIDPLILQHRRRPVMRTKHTLPRARRRAA